MDDTTQMKTWFAARLPRGWYMETPEILVDRDEILVIGRIRDVTSSEDGDQPTARSGRIRGHREETREERMRIAAEAQRKFSRRVAWGVCIGDSCELFTHLAIPVMTRLRMRERLVLDQLVGAGVVQNRSQALAWCVRLVAERQAEWLDDLSEAIRQVESVREKAPHLN